MTDQVLVAAAPALRTLLAAIKEAANSTLSGDPLLIGARAPAAFGILVLKASELVPEVSVAEEGLLLTDITNKLNALDKHLADLAAPPPA